MLSDVLGTELLPSFVFLMAPLSTTATIIATPTSDIKHMWLLTEDQQISPSLTVKSGEWMEVLFTTPSKSIPGDMKVCLKCPGEEQTYTFPMTKFHYTVPVVAPPLSL